MKSPATETVAYPRSNAGHPTRGAARRPAEVARPGDLAQLKGRPLTTSQLAAIVGMSPTFIRKEIDSGYLRATRIGRGRKPVFRIPLQEARRYMKELGLL